MTTSKPATVRTAGHADFGELVEPHWDVLVRVAGRLAPPGSRTTCCRTP